MSSSRRSARSIEEHLLLGLPVLFSELVVFKWTPSRGFPAVTDEFRLTFEHMQEVENLGNELRVFFSSYDGALDALDTSEVRRNTFRFLDQYGTIEDLLKNDILRTTNIGRGLVPEYLEERIRNQQKWFRGDDRFSLEFAREFLRRKFSVVRNSFRAPQPTSLLPPVPPPRRHRSGSSIQQQSSRPADEPLFDPSQPSTSQVVSGYTASGRPRRNSAPVSALSPPKPRRQTAVEQLPSPPPTPPLLRSQRDQQQQQQHVDRNIFNSKGSNDGCTTPGANAISEDPAENGTSPPQIGAEISADEAAAPSQQPAGPLNTTVTTPSAPAPVRNASQTNSAAEDVGKGVEISQRIDHSGSECTSSVDANANGTEASGTMVVATAGQSRVSRQLNEVFPEPVDQVVQEIVEDLARRVFMGVEDNRTASIHLNDNDRPGIDNGHAISSSGSNNNNNNSSSHDNNNTNNNNNNDSNTLAAKLTGALEVTDKLAKDESRLIEDDRPLQETAM